MSACFNDRHDKDAEMKKKEEPIDQDPRMADDDLWMFGDINAIRRLRKMFF